MAYTVKAYALEKINLAPEDITEEVLQNVAVILSTPKFSVPFRWSGAWGWRNGFLINRFRRRSQS